MALPRRNCMPRPCNDDDDDDDDKLILAAVLSLWRWCRRRRLGVKFAAKRIGPCICNRGTNGAAAVVVVVVVVVIVDGYLALITWCLAWPAPHHLRLRTVAGLAY